MIKKIGVNDDLNELNRCDVAKLSEISLVTFFQDLSGKDWNPRQDRSLKG